MKLSGMRYYKFFMLFFNFLNIVTGALIIGCCFLYIRERKYKPEPQSTVSRGVLAFCITLALFMILTAVLGCVGAMKQHIKTLYVQICFYIFLISIEGLVGIGAAVINAWVGDGNDLRLHFYKNTTLEENIARQRSWDRLQIQMHCCGVDGPQDYAIIHREIPPSCCSTVYGLHEGAAKRELHIACLNERTFYVRSCEDAVRSRKTRHERLAALYVCMLIFNELSIVTMSVSMVRRIRRQQRQLQQNLQAHFES